LAGLKQALLLALVLINEFLKPGLNDLWNLNVFHRGSGDMGGRFVGVDKGYARGAILKMFFE
jgi:hypothetical protein